VSAAITSIGSVGRRLVTAWEVERRLAPPWFVQTPAGVRPGEAYALRRDDLDLTAGEARITRTLPDDGTRVGCGAASIGARS
jgi:hypothetical protein